MAAPTLAPKPVALFCLHAALLAVLIGLWPTPRALYPPLFHARAEALFSAVSDSPLRFGPAEPEGPDTRMSRWRAGAPVWTSEFGAVRLGWWPAAALLALLLATPLAPGRRALAALAGLLLLELFALARVGIEVAYLDLELARGPGGAASGPLHLLLRAGSESLTATIPSAAAVLAVWVAVARPRGRIDATALGLGGGAKPA